MRTEIPQIMNEKKIDAFFLYEPNGTLTSPNMTWATRVSSFAHATFYIWPKNSKPTLICSPMEQEQATKSGLNFIDSQEFDDSVNKIENVLNRDATKIINVLDYFSIKPNATIEFHTRMDANKSFFLMQELARRNNYTFVNGYNQDTLAAARETKGPGEIAIIEKNAKISDKIFKGVIKLLKDASTVGYDNRRYLINDDNSFMYVRDLKKHIRMQLFANGLIDTEETVFSTGANCANPHHRGNPGNRLEYGKTIIMDMFPQQIGGGYFFDETRTWFLGKPPEKIQNAYNDVLEVQEWVMTQFEPDTPTKKYQELVNEFLKQRGHVVPVDGSRPRRGFRHSVGHGFGLEIHETPFVSELSGHTIRKGSVFTVEPGLYESQVPYVDENGVQRRGYGIRLEDVIAMHPETGESRNLTKTPKKLQIK